MTPFPSAADPDSRLNRTVGVKKLITLSLLANVIVLVPVCSLLALNGERATEVFGAPTPARGILLSIYFSILVSSAILLIEKSPKPVAALLLVQIVYKISTPATVGAFQHPVVISNLIISALHALTLIAIFRTAGNPFKNIEATGSSTANSKA
jgi:hypothetical protein